MRLRNAPLVHVLAQVVFPAIPNLRDAIPGLHSILRGQGYSRLEERTLQSIEVVAGGAPSVTVSPRWDFLNRERDTCVSVTESFLVLATTSYSTFSEFEAKLSSALRGLSSVSRVDCVDRLGLRYIDLVQPSSGVGFEALVRPGLLGFAGCLPSSTPIQVNGLRTETVGASEHGVLAVRSILAPPGMFLPPDLLPAVLAFPPSRNTGRPSLILDFDHYVEFGVNPIDFEIDGMLEQFRGLHGILKKTFAAAVTDRAIEEWGPWETVTE